MNLFLQNSTTKIFIIDSQLFILRGYFPFLYLSFLFRFERPNSDLAYLGFMLKESWSKKPKLGVTRSVLWELLRVQWKLVPCIFLTNKYGIHSSNVPVFVDRPHIILAIRNTFKVCMLLYIHGLLNWEACMYFKTALLCSPCKFNYSIIIQKYQLGNLTCDRSATQTNTLEPLITMMLFRT